MLPSIKKQTDRRGDCGGATMIVLRPHLQNNNCSTVDLGASKHNMQLAALGEPLRLIRNMAENVCTKPTYTKQHNVRDDLSHPTASPRGH